MCISLSVSDPQLQIDLSSKKICVHNRCKIGHELLWIQVSICNKQPPSLVEGAHTTHSTVPLAFVFKGKTRGVVYVAFKQL
jgi:hypothetical protein